MRIALLLLASLASCIQPSPHQRAMAEDRVWESHGADLQPGQTISQAMLGISQFETAERSGGNDPDVPSSSDLEELPLIAGAIQEAMGGDEHFDYGIEGGAAVGFTSSGGFVAAGGSGGLIVAVDIDLLLVDVFFGPFVSLNVGERVRFYGGAGPLIDFASYSHEGEEGATRVEEDGTGLGLGWYARGGVEVLLGDQYMFGVGYRWVDSRIALSGDLGTLDVVGSQVFVSLSMGF